jgi:predicted nucleotide-binding protein
LTDLLATTPPVTSPIAPPEPAEDEVKVLRVFISHCQSKNILRQVRQMLDYGKVEMVIAEEKETAGVPLSDKAFDLMWECNSAIINISPDAEKKQEKRHEKKKQEKKLEKKQEKIQEKKQEVTLGINENVLAELWGAYLHYKKRVILVIDKRLKDKLPSIMQGLITIFYERNQLSWTDGMRLQNALNEFRNQL